MITKKVWVIIVLKSDLSIKTGKIIVTPGSSNDWYQSVVCVCFEILSRNLQNGYLQGTITRLNGRN